MIHSHTHESLVTPIKKERTHACMYSDACKKEDALTYLDSEYNISDVYAYFDIKQRISYAFIF